MSLLEFEHVTRRYRQGAHEQVVLDDVSLELHTGELVAIWGLRRSGRSTLLRIAAGIEPPDRGVVRFKGRDLSRRGRNALGSEIGYCQRTFLGTEGGLVLEELIVDQLARGVAQEDARDRAWAALERTGAGDCAPRRMTDLDNGEDARVRIAAALALDPSLLVIDEPTKGVDLLERDAILSLMRTIANGGVAVLMSVGEGTGLSGTDRALSLSGGRLRGMLAPELATVVPLHRRAGG